MELAAALFQSIRMQLAVERYYGEAVERAANLDTLDSPVSDVMWLRRQILDIRKMDDSMAQIAAVQSLLFRTDPGPGGFYDQLGNVSNRPHLVLGPGSTEDPDFRKSPQIRFPVPGFAPGQGSDRLEMLGWIALRCASDDAVSRPGPKDAIPGACRLYGETLQDPINGQRYGSDSSLHWWDCSWGIASTATACSAGVSHSTRGDGKRELKLSWTREPGLGGSGTGCNVAEDG